LLPTIPKVNLAPFDTHLAIKNLLKPIVTLQKEVVDSSLQEVATKQDVKEVRMEMRLMESRIVIKLGSMLIIGFGLVLASIKYL